MKGPISIVGVIKPEKSPMDYFAFSMMKMKPWVLGTLDWMRTHFDKPWNIWFEFVLTTIA
jgi:hypothetical protein